MDAERLELVALGIILERGKAPQGVTPEALECLEVRQVLRAKAAADKAKAAEVLGVKCNGEPLASLVLRKVAENAQRRRNRQLAARIQDAAMVMTPEQFREYVMKEMGL